MTTPTRLMLVSMICASTALPALAQTEPPAPLIVIAREEVRPGKGAAHAANEAAWGAAFTRMQAPVGWLGMRSMAGPSEAWFITPYASYEAWQKAEEAVEANASLTAENDKFSGLDGEFLSRTSNIVASYRPGLSYQPEGDLSKMRYVEVNVVRVKPGHDAEFREAWRAIVEAHKTAKMDEHWRVYQVWAGMPDGTFLFFFATPDLATLDRSGPMHGADAYRNAVGEAGRARQREMQIQAVDSSQRLLFQLSPQLSSLPKAWTDADPYWAPKLPAPGAAKRPADKR